MSRNAVIIGGGPAGLTAAYELLAKTDIVPFVFEEDVRVGGLSKTVPYKGNRMDLGGHRFFSKDDAVTAWWNSMMPLQGKPSKDDILLHTADKKLADSEVDPEDTDRVMLVRRRVSRIFYLRKLFDYPISLKLRTFANMGLFRTIHAGCGYLLAVIRKRKENSLEDFYINRFGKPLYKMFFEDYTEKLWGVHPSKLGADWGSQRVKGLSVLSILKDMVSRPFRKTNLAQKNVETSLIEQFVYPKFGPGQLWETVAAEIEDKGGTVATSSKVEKVNVENRRVVSVTVSQNGTSRTVPCDYLFSSMPVKDLVASLQGISIPDEVAQTARTLPYRDFITVGLLVKKLKIENRTKIPTVGCRIPDTWVYIQERDVKLGRLQIFNNWSPYMVADYENTMFLGLEYFCTEGDEMWNMDKEAFIGMAVGEMVKIGIVDREDVIDSTQIKVKKAYPAYYGSYSRLPAVIEFLNGIGNLYCIGRNGQHRYNNMDHSMMTAMTAVQNIIHGVAAKDNIWNVNTDSSYHEEKKG